MKMKVALGVIVSLTAITLNTIPAENDTKMRMENEIICETEIETIANIEDEIEMTDSEIVIQDTPKTENLSKQPKMYLQMKCQNRKITSRMNSKMLILTAILRKAKPMSKGLDM